MTLLAERPSAAVTHADPGVPIDVTSLDLSSYEEFAGRMRFTRETCDFLERIGILSERYELIDGEIILKMGHNRLHAVAMVLLMKWLNSIFAGDRIQCQLPLEVAEVDRATNRPEPDASVLVRSALEFCKSTPGPGDIQLVVEISDTSLANDIRVKSGLYARAGFPDYWVLDVQSRRLYVHRDPFEGAYTTITVIGDDETIAPLSASENAVCISELLPQPEAAS